MLCAIITIAGFNNILLFKGIQRSICHIQ